MVSTERGPIVRVGTSTTNITPLSTTSTSTGLPPQRFTTSFVFERFVLDGHDLSSHFSGLRQSNFSLAGGGSVVYSNLSLYSTQGLSNNGITTSGPPGIFTGGLPNNSLPVPVTATTYYKMTGFYVTGSVYESFVTLNSPALPTTTNPNTGHTLVNTFVAATWTI